MSGERPTKGNWDPRQGNDSDLPVYVISVVAEVTGLHPQTLRGYERAGLVSPARTTGGIRRYSATDLRRIQRICELTAEGVNVAGVALVLTLEDQLATLGSRRPTG